MNAIDMHYRYATGVDLAINIKSKYRNFNIFYLL